MKSSYLNIILILVALVAVALFKCPPAAIIIVTFEIINIIPTLSTIITVLETRSMAPKGLSNYIIITIINIYGNYLFFSFGLDAGGSSLVGNPSPTKLANNAFTQYTFPIEWAGRVYVGPNLNPNNNKIKGSFTSPPNIDISYVDNYSVPIMCSSEGIVVTGYNINLFM